VLDDFGEQAGTPWAQEKLYQVINHRYNARLATVITTSSSLDEIENRISSRLVDPKISVLSMLWRRISAATGHRRKELTDRREKAEPPVSAVQFLSSEQ